GHALENLVLEDQVARVIALREKQILVQRLRLHVMPQHVVLHVFQSELALRDCCQSLHPIGNRQFLGNGFVCGLVHAGSRTHRRSDSIIPRPRGRSAAVPAKIPANTTKSVEIQRPCIDGAKIETMELLGKSREELRDYCLALGEPAYRGDQLYEALYAQRK